MIELGKDDIRDLFDFQTGADAVRAAYVAMSEGRVQAPPVTYLGFSNADGDCHVKSGHIDGDEGFVIKIATGFYQNPAKGLPSSNGMNIVFSAETGALMGLLRDDGWLTDMRTGIGGALATQALANDGFTDVLIVGAGLQARHQAKCLQNLISDRQLEFVIWGRRPDQALTTATELRRGGLKTRVATDLEQACGNAQAIITVTPSKTPLIRKDWIRPGTHITAIGADCPGKQELETDLAGDADLLVCDLASQCLDHGELQTLHSSGSLAEGDVTALGLVLSGAHAGRAGRDDITIADLTGLAAQDAAISLAVLRAAKRNT